MAIKKTNNQQSLQPPPEATATITTEASCAAERLRYQPTVTEYLDNSLPKQRGKAKSKARCRAKCWCVCLAKEIYYSLKSTMYLLHIYGL